MRPFILNLKGSLVEVTRPVVMAIVNATPDSFFAGSRTPASDPDAIAGQASRLVSQGADWLDVGACSTRQGSLQPSEQEEIDRLAIALKAIKSVAPEVPVSVDTYRASVARFAVEQLGADMINDISGGDLDPEMAPTIAALKVPYIIMHMRGTPASMQSLTDYGSSGVSADVVLQLSRKVERLRDLGIADIIVDPGFGFAKTVEQNFTLLGELPLVAEALPDTPMLVGLSRKSMLYKPMGLSPDDVLPATTAANTLALLAGVAILRVHDPEAAVQARMVVGMTPRPSSLPRISCQHP